MTVEKDHLNDLDSFNNLDEDVEFNDNPLNLKEKESKKMSSIRKALLEQALSNVKGAIKKKLSFDERYEKGALVYDEESEKFARVIESKPGFLNLDFLSGGKKQLKDTFKLDFIKKYRHSLTLPQMAEKLSLSDIEVISLLNEVELSEEKSKKNGASKKAVAEKKSKKPPKLKAVVNKKDKKTKPSIKIAAKDNSKKSISMPKKEERKQKPMPPMSSFTKILPKGATTDPIVDPNGYIQQNFLLLSNKELANATGLSEHTVRRKLGEWGLRRRDFTNRAQN